MCQSCKHQAWPQTWELGKKISPLMMMSAASNSLSRGVLCYIKSRAWLAVSVRNAHCKHVMTASVKCPGFLWGRWLLGRLLPLSQTDIQAAGRRQCGFKIYFGFSPPWALLVVRRRISSWIHIFISYEFLKLCASLASDLWYCRVSDDIHDNYHDMRRF